MVLDQAFLARLAIGFVVRQIQKFGKEVNVAQLKADFKARVEKLVPGQQFDDIAVACVNAVIDACFEFLASADMLSKILTAVIAGKFQDAIDALMAFVQSKMPQLALC